MVYSSNRRIIYPRQRTDVIFMAMCYDHGFNFVAPFLDECGVWDNLLHTKLIIIWEHNPCINQDISIIVPHKHTIHADFAKTANREYSEGRTIHPFIELLHFSLDRILQALSGTLGSSQPFPRCSRFLRPFPGGWGRDRAARDGDGGGSGGGAAVSQAAGAERREGGERHHGGGGGGEGGERAERGEGSER